MSQLLAEVLLLVGTDGTKKIIVSSFVIHDRSLRFLMNLMNARALLKSRKNVKKDQSDIKDNQYCRQYFSLIIYYYYVIHLVEIETGRHSKEETNNT